ncbi:MAG: BrnA antitoxin family protein [Spirochaetales bacterium]|nr:BrnA antitoxin family protein [Spirochaetales bacterium]
MKNEYDFTDSVKNPYTKGLKKQISIRIDEDVIGYFKELSNETGIPYQNLINLFLADCASKHLKPKISWNK